MEKQPYLRLNFNSDSLGRSMNVEALVQTFVSQIEGDRGLDGCRLPPVRVLAHQLGLSKNTVQAAYDELKARGLVESQGRRGLFISIDSASREVKLQKRVPRPRFRTIPPVSRGLFRERGKIHLNSVFVDPRILPKDRIAACFRSVLKAPGIPEFYDQQGMPALREKIASRLRDRGMEVDASEIIITNGSQQALDLVSRSLETQVIATEDPSYRTGKSLFEMNGMRTVGLPIDPFSGVDLAVWEERLAREKPGLVYLTTSFQNPNGYSYTSAEISKIIDWSSEFGFGIIEDDWGSDMQSYSEFRPSLRALGGNDVLYMNSFTKKLLPSLRLGYLVASQDTLEPLLMAKRVSTIAAPALIEAALFEFLDRGYFDTHLRAIQKELDIRYEHCLALLRETMPDVVRWTSPGGGPVLWLELPRHIDLNLLRERLEKRGVLLQLSQDAFFGEPHSHGFKIGYAFLSLDEMDEAIGMASEEIRSLLK